MNEEAAAALEDCRPLLWEIVKFLRQGIPVLMEEMHKTGSSYDGEIPPIKAVPPDEHEENLTPYLQYIEEALLVFRVKLCMDVLQLDPPGAPMEKKFKSK